HRHLQCGESNRRDRERSACGRKCDSKPTICIRLHHGFCAPNLNGRPGNGRVVRFVDDLPRYYILGKCGTGEEKKGRNPTYSHQPAFFLWHKQSFLFLTKLNLNSSDCYFFATSTLHHPFLNKRYHVFSPHLHYINDYGGSAAQGYGVADESDMPAVGRPRWRIKCALTTIEIGDDFGPARCSERHQSQHHILVRRVSIGVDVHRKRDKDHEFSVG